MLEGLKNARPVKRLRKMPWYVRYRQRFLPSRPDTVFDDRDRIDGAQVVTIEWPAEVRKPRIAIIQDYGPYPRWTKYCRFLDNNHFDYDFLNLHRHDWMECASQFDVIAGIVSCELHDLQEMQRKYWVLERSLAKVCYPSPAHIFLYEDKFLEAYIARACDVPFATTYVSENREDALELSASLPYPLVSKIVPSSASVGVEMVRNPKQCRNLVEQAFSPGGRGTHSPYFKQKNYVYLQEYVPNDGYDIRAIVIGNRITGYYRKVLEGDFRASGMGIYEKRELPTEAMRIACRLNQVVKSPMLVVDMVHGLDGKYYILEFSPVCQVNTPETLHVNGVPGVYIVCDDGSFRFEQGRYWVHELALREFLLTEYLGHPKPAQAVQDGDQSSEVGPC